MRLLLDTQALLWWLDDDRKLGSSARALIADPANDVSISVVSLWEIVTKCRAGKLRVDLAALLGAIAPEGFSLINIEPAHLLMLEKLPSHHRDPFDHLLVAQALSEDATLMTEDRRLSAYPARVVCCADT